MQKHQETEQGRGACPEDPVFSCYTLTGDHLQSGSTSSWIIKPVWSERWWRKWVCGGCELCIGLWYRVRSSLHETDALNVFTSYKKTSETLSTAGQKTSAAFSTLSSTISRRFGDMRYAASCSSVPVRTPSPHSGLYWCLCLLVPFGEKWNHEKLHEATICEGLSLPPLICVL